MYRLSINQVNQLQSFKANFRLLSIQNITGVSLVFILEDWRRLGLIFTKFYGVKLYSYFLRNMLDKILTVSEFCVNKDCVLLPVVGRPSSSE